MLFALYMILFVGGMWVMGLGLNAPAFQGVIFVLGILMISGALATPMIASGLEHRGDDRR